MVRKDGRNVLRIPNLGETVLQESEFPYTKQDLEKKQSGEDYTIARIQRNWATPTATQHKGWSKGHNRAETNDRLDYQAERPNSLSGLQAPMTQTDGSKSSESDQTSPQPSQKRLNPNFVEWLMAVPIGWTDLKPLEMDSFHQWLQNFYEG